MTDMTISEDVADAKRFFAQMYLNTGCDLDEAEEFADFMFGWMLNQHQDNKRVAADALRTEAYVYQDM